MFAVEGMLFELPEHFCLKVYLRAAVRSEIQVKLSIGLACFQHIRIEQVICSCNCRLMMKPNISAVIIFSTYKNGIPQKNI
jgi:hypothetical protein